MTFFRSGKIRLLYVLALAQLVGGPVILLLLTLFCKVALHEAPRVGMAQAVVRAWQSDDFQAALASADVARTSNPDSPAAPAGPKQKMEKGKLPVVPWEPSSWISTVVWIHHAVPDHPRVWTPAWPQAPPGPPPRMG